MLKVIYNVVDSFYVFELDRITHWLDVAVSVVARTQVRCKILGKGSGDV